MIEELQVENYRSFKTYSVNGLKRVNLLTGRNNSGKTSLLEAVEFLSSKGDPGVLADIAIRRSELLSMDSGAFASRPDTLVDAAHLFFGHRLVPGSAFQITSGDLKNSVIVRVAKQSEFEKSPILIDMEESDDASPYVIVIERTMPNRSRSSIPMQLSANGGFRARDARSIFRSAIQQEPTFPLQLITADSLQANQMAMLWDGVLRERREGAVFESLRILDEAIEDVAFLNDERSVRSGRLGVVLGCRGQDRRMPLGSYGEGMRRLLALSMSLVSVSKGILLVDEIDTGLHYSVLADMWKLVIGTAIKNDIQVFATTHSLDCLRGLNAACERDPELASEISLQTIDRNLDVSIAGDASDLKSAMNMGIEVR